MLGVRDSWNYKRMIRPTVEWNATIVCYLLMFSCLVSPTVIGVPPVIAYMMAVIWFLLGNKYFKEARSHFSFINGLWRIKPFHMHPNDLPGTDDTIYLGRGFLITPIHTQRLYELNNETTRKYMNPPAMYFGFRKAEAFFGSLSKFFLIGIPFAMAAAALREPRWYNPFPYFPIDLLDPNNTYGNPYLHGVGGDEEQDLFAPFADSNSHTLVLGTTRQGKTINAGIVVTQDIMRFSKSKSGDDCAVIMIDPKGDLELAVRMFIAAYRAGKADKFYFFHLAYPHLSVRYNSIAEYSRETEVATRTTNPLSDSGNSKVFKDFAWQFINISAMALKRMGKTPTYKIISKYLKDPELLAEDYISRVIRDDELDGIIHAIADKIENNKKDLSPQERSKNPRSIALTKLISDPPEDYVDLIRNDDVLRSIADGLKHDRSYYDKITASAKPHLDKLTSGAVADLISPNYDDVKDQRPIIDLKQIISSGGILYAGLDFQSDPVTGAAVGNGFLTEILSISGEIYNYGIDNGMPIEKDKKRRKPMVRLHIDEANEIFGKEFNPILNKAGGSGVSVVAYTQTISDAEVKLESPALAAQALGNFGTIISFKVRGQDTSTYLSELTQMVRVMTDTPDTKAADGMGSAADGQFKSSNSDSASFAEERLIPEYAFRDLPKGQAYVYAQSRWYKVRMPIFLKDEDMPKDLAEMERVIASVRGYSTSKLREYVR